MAPPDMFFLDTTRMLRINRVLLVDQDNRNSAVRGGLAPDYGGLRDPVVVQGPVDNVVYVPANGDGGRVVGIGEVLVDI
jgi:hypothetical protein